MVMYIVPLGSVQVPASICFVGATNHQVIAAGLDGEEGDLDLLVVRLSSPLRDLVRKPRHHHRRRRRYV